MEIEEQQAKRNIDTKIAAWTRAHKTTSVELAKKINLSQCALSTKRNGKTSWRLQDLLALCKVMNCSIEQLIA